MIVVLVDAKGHDEIAAYLDMFRPDFDREKEGDLFLVSNTGPECARIFRSSAGFQQSFSVERGNVLTVCTGTPKSGVEVSLKKENDTLHRYTELGMDGKKKASVVITRCEVIKSGLGPITVANVMCGPELFSSYEAVDILERMAALIRDGNHGKAMIAFNIALPITRECMRAMNVLLEKRQYYLLNDSPDTRRNLRNGILMSDNLHANSFSKRDDFFLDNNMMMIPFVLQYFKAEVRGTPSDDPVSDGRNKIPMGLRPFVLGDDASSNKK